MASLGTIGDLYYKTKMHVRALGKQTEKQRKKRSYNAAVRKDTKLVKIVKSAQKKETKSLEPTLVAPVISLQDKLLQIREKMSTDESVLHGTQTRITEGFVYLMHNPIHPKWVKAGMTVDYERRLADYNFYNPEGTCKLIGVKWTENRRVVEKVLLGHLCNISSHRNGEWFTISMESALDIFYNC